MGGLVSLEALDLHNNMIGSLPDDVLQCRALRTLDLSNNNLHSLPENLGDLDNLTELVLSDNQISALPSSIGWYQLLATAFSFLLFDETRDAFRKDEETRSAQGFQE